VAFKANICEVCGLAFKWPHDLKKHGLKTGHVVPGNEAVNDTMSLDRPKKGGVKNLTRSHSVREKMAKVS
jgi:hypothetical protein